MQMEWQRDNRNRLRLVLAGRNYGPMVKTVEAARRWCRDSSIHVQEDSFFSIRFADEQDLSWFLMRWA